MFFFIESNPDNMTYWLAEMDTYYSAHHVQLIVVGVAIIQPPGPPTK